MPGKPGRKPTGKDPLFNFRLAPSQAQRLDRLVKESGTTRSAVFRTALDRYLREQEEVPEAS